MHFVGDDPLDKAPASDEWLISAFRDGDHGAMNELVQRHRDGVYRLGLRYLGDPQDAEDVCQEVFISVITKAASFDGRARFTTWLYRVAVNRSLDMVRRRQRSLSDVSGDEGLAHLHSGDDTERAAIGLVEAGRVQAALNSVPGEYRATVILCDLLDMKYAEIAEIMDVPIGTVRSRISRGRALLATALEPTSTETRPSSRSVDAEASIPVEEGG